MRPTHISILPSASSHQHPLISIFPLTCTSTVLNHTSKGKRRNTVQNTVPLSTATTLFCIISLTCPSEWLKGHHPHGKHPSLTTHPQFNLTSKPHTTVSLPSRADYTSSPQPPFFSSFHNLQRLCRQRGRTLTRNPSTRQLSPPPPLGALYPIAYSPLMQAKPNPSIFIHAVDSS